MIKASEHLLHIPVMGTGFTLDTAIKVAPYGISSSVSLVDDVLIEKVRKHYCEKYNLPYSFISSKTEDARATRIREYLNLMDDLVVKKIKEIRALPFEIGNEKDKYFEMLPSNSKHKKRYREYMQSKKAKGSPEVEAELNDLVRPGSIDCNIMTKVDRQTRDANGESLGPLFTDAKSALRGMATGKSENDIVFSAGMNPTLYGYIESFPTFYCQGDDLPKKGVILKIADFRSAMIQSKFLAKKGILVKEWRLESGINCGGHAFVADGYLMGPILEEFLEKRDDLMNMIYGELEKYYKHKDQPVPPQLLSQKTRLTVQGGLGNSGENFRLLENYKVDGFGWASPFLLVREVTSLDDITREKLRQAEEKDIYLSDASPLGIPFYNLRGSTSEIMHDKLIEQGKPGSACPKSFLISNTEFKEIPICTASSEYIEEKLETLGNNAPKENKQKVLVKECICHNLGNGVLKDYGILKSESTPVSVCPGPNLAYFKKEHTLFEMMKMIYGEAPPLSVQKRPHVFAKELTLYVEYFKDMAKDIPFPTDADLKRLLRIKENLEIGIEYYWKMLKNTKPFLYENIDSIKEALEEGLEGITTAWKGLQANSIAA